MVCVLGDMCMCMWVAFVRLGCLEFVLQRLCFVQSGQCRVRKLGSWAKRPNLAKQKGHMVTHFLKKIETKTNHPKGFENLYI